MTQPKHKPEAKPTEAKPVTIEVRQRSRVRWGDRVFGPGRRIEVPKDKLDELEGDYDEVQTS
jgi:hypothetical protein